MELHLITISIYRFVDQRPGQKVGKAHERLGRHSDHHGDAEKDSRNRDRPGHQDRG